MAITNFLLGQKEYYKIKRTGKGFIVKRQRLFIPEKLGLFPTAKIAYRACSHHYRYKQREIKKVIVMMNNLNNIDRQFDACKALIDELATSNKYASG